MESIILHIMVVSFHHRNGPQVDYCLPPFPSSNGADPSPPTDGQSAVALPEEWSFMPFMCLPDGAHAAEEEYIYFHLPPVKGWSAPSYKQTLFGLACFRQIDSKDLLNRPADVTRSKVQKSVVVLANQCVLGSVRSKLGLVTQAFFAQRDFSKLGLSLRELIFKFRQKALQLFKLLLLGKRILFFGHSVERLSAYQYGLVSLIPELLRNLHDVGTPALENFPVSLPVGRTVSLQDQHRSMDNLRSHQIDSHKAKLLKLGHPLRIFGKGAFFQPYIPLQQMDVLESPDTLSFLSGTSNAIFTHHKSCNIDVVAYADTGSIEIINPAINALISLSAADRKFIDDLVKPISSSWAPDNDMSQIQQIDFEGSDDDIRARFETYITQLFASVEYDTNTPNNDPAIKKIDYLSEYNLAWVQAWKTSQSYATWVESRNADYISMLNPGHPLHGHSMLDSIAASFSAFGKNLTPSTPVTPAATVDGVTQETPVTPGNPSSATQIIQNVSSWYATKKSQYLGSGSNDTPSNPVLDELKNIQQQVDDTKSSDAAPKEGGAPEENFQSVSL